MNLTITLLGIAIALGGCASAQMQKIDLLAQEAMIRAIVNGQERLPYSSGAVFWSGAYPRSQIGQETVKPFNEAAIGRRRNEKTTTQIVHLEVAEAGDMAYEFFNFTLSYDRADTKQHISFTG